VSIVTGSALEGRGSMSSKEKRADGLSDPVGPCPVGTRLLLGWRRPRRVAVHSPRTSTES
jgi:hypothetical protein